MFMLLPLLAAAAGVTVQPTLPPPAPYPSVAVLDELAKVCARVDDRAETLKRMDANGWVLTNLDPKTPLGALLEMGKSAGGAMVKAQKGAMQPAAAYSKNVAGEALTIILSGVTIDGAVVSGCRMYDPGETRPLPVADAEKWMGRKPSGVNANAAISIATWKPGFTPGHDTFDVYFIPKDSPLISALKVTGVAIRVDHVKRPKPSKF